MSGPHPGRLKWGIIVGTALEWYDFYLYAAMAAVVFGPVFFPSADRSTAALASVATFAVGFLARPLGGIVFGALGDRIGRKKVLVLTFALMGTASVLIGLIPSYASIGIAAPVLLVVVRIVQGLGAGAEHSTATIIAYEHATDDRRGRQGAWPSLGASIGLFVSSLTISGLTSLPDDVVVGWAWRVPFLASILLVGVGLWVRRALPESPEFEREGRPERLSLLGLLKGPNLLGVAVVTLLTIGYNALSYTFKTFSLTYLQDFRDLPANVGAFGITLASGLAILLIPLLGRLCDRVGTRVVLLSASVAAALLAFPFFWLLDTGRTALVWLALILASGVVVPAMFAAKGSFFAGQFPVDVRSAGVASGQEVGGSFAGGLAPLVALSLVSFSDGHATWGVSLLFVAGAAMVGAACLLGRGEATRRRAGERAAAEPAATP